MLDLTMSLSRSTFVLLFLLLLAPLATCIDWDFSELSHKKQPPSSRVRARKGPVFTDGDYVIMLFRPKNIHWDFPGCMVGQDLNHHIL